MPQIGEMQRGVWVASGFAGRGLNTTAIAGELVARASTLQAEIKQLKRTEQDLRIKVASETVRLTGLAPNVQISGPVVVPEDGEEIAGGIKLVRLKREGLDKVSLRTVSDNLRDKLKSGVVVLASPQLDKITFSVSVTSDLTKRISAGEIAKTLAALVGGKGGGRPDFAEAGGKDPSKTDELLAASRDIIEKMLSA